MADCSENYSKEDVIFALQIFSNRKETEKEKFKEAELFLKKIEKTKSIWIIANDILLMNSLDSQVNYLKIPKNSIHQILRFIISQPDF